MRSDVWLTLGAVWMLLTGGEVSATEVWTGWRTVTSIEVIENGGFLISFSTAIGAPCAAAGPNTLYVDAGQHYVTPDGVKALLSVAMTAFATGRLLDVLYDDSTSYCYGRYITISQ